MEYSEFWLRFEKLTYDADRVDKNRDLRCLCSKEEERLRLNGEMGK